MASSISCELASVPVKTTKDVNEAWNALQPETPQLELLVAESSELGCSSEAIRWSSTSGVRINAFGRTPKLRCSRPGSPHFGPIGFAEDTPIACSPQASVTRRSNIDVLVPPPAPTLRATYPPLSFLEGLPPLELLELPEAASPVGSEVLVTTSGLPTTDVMRGPVRRRSQVPPPAPRLGPKKAPDFDDIPPLELPATAIESNEVVEKADSVQAEEVDSEHGSNMHIVMKGFEEFAHDCCVASISQGVYDVRKRSWESSSTASTDAPGDMVALFRSYMENSRSVSPAECSSRPSTPCKPSPRGERRRHTFSRCLDSP